MNSDGALYGFRANGGLHGDVFTSPGVVRYMLDLVGYTSERDLRNVSILEPACGDGEFVVEIARRLQASASHFHFDAADSFRRNVQAFEIDAVKVGQCQARLHELGIGNSDNVKVADFLSADVATTDIVIGNPPYVRYENLPEGKAAELRFRFKTFHYRSDLYIPFFEKTLRLLNPGGIHCFICSNRWLKNEYGRKLRTFISAAFQLRRVINLEQADAFQEAVLAYPAITVIAAEPSSGVFEYGECEQISRLTQVCFSSRNIPSGGDWTEAFLDNIRRDHLLTLTEQGFKIGIGVATGADSVFISKDLPKLVEPQLIIPGIGSRDLRGNRMQWQGNYLLNPYTSSGKLINLDDFPMAKAYLCAHRERLSARHVAQKHPSRWYKTIDMISPALLTQPKVLLPDMSGNTVIFVDEGKYYPLHNIYYITGHSITQLQLLAAVLMSDFIRSQLSSVTNQMNGGFARWQSQHLHKLRLPLIGGMTSLQVSRLLEYYKQTDLPGINSVVDHLLEYPGSTTSHAISVPMQYSLQFSD